LRKRRPFVRIVQLFIVLLALFITLSTMFYSLLEPVQKEGQGQEVTFVVERGTPSKTIANNLEQAGLIKSAKAFLLYARLTGNLENFKAGEYLLKTSDNAKEIINILVQGKIVTVSFTIPEGYHLRQIADVLVKEGITTEEEFWRVVSGADFDYDFLEGLPKNERRLEGYLFPDTYIIPKGWETEKVINTMLKRFAEVYNGLPANKSGLNMRDTVVLASIVEAESRVDKDRPLIASVFLNRLKIKMPLQADATLQYVFAERKERVLYKDLETDDPYNTYKYGGLPPGPICSPGEASLRAVCEPAETDYYYFVAKKDGSGEHVFSRTLAEHNANKRKLGY